MSTLADFHFLRPWCLLALALLPMAWLAWRHVRGEAGNWRNVVDAHLLRHLVETSLERSRHGGVWLAAVIWTLGCVTLAGPAWERESMPLYRNEAARILAIELAPTMLAADLKPTRLERARYKLNDILKLSRDQQTALIGYSGDAFVAAPLTDDVNTVRNLIDALDPGVMPVVGNATERAIEEAQRLVEQAGLAQGELILLADSSSDRALAAARAANARGLTISVLGIGSGVGAPVPLPQGGFLQDAAGNIVLPRLDEAGLRALAEAGGGRYARMSTDGSDLEYLLDVQRDKSGARKVDDDHALSEHFLDRGPWFVLVLVPLALLAFRRGWMMVLALALNVPVPQAQAFEWADLWQRPDQRAAEALAEGDAATAQSLAADPEWRGSAAYRAEDFEAASQAFAEAKGSEASYNRGNALAREGKYEEAIAAYEQALQADPANEDAEANKQAVEEWLKRQQKEQQDNKQDSSSQQGEQDKQDKQDSNDSGDQQDSEQQQDGQPQDDQQQDSQGDKQDKDADQDDAQSDDAQGKQKDGQEEGKPEQSGDNKPEPGDSSNESEQQKSRAEEAEEKARKEQQKQQLSEAMDQAIDGQQSDQQPVPMASPEQEAAREQEQALNQWLQRVPDDPGGLLRRKFQLEYERRQRDGGGG
ncbi:VWA domain-containing protein [Dokdonella sp.]|uniref:VWA domain-containing protein n=1 Tax=Dokdonella sp. TaxID=2291710 RepID=UPI003529693F